MRDTGNLCLVVGTDPFLWHSILFLNPRYSRYTNFRHDTTKCIHKTYSNIQNTIHLRGLRRAKAESEGFEPPVLFQGRQFSKLLL